MQDGATDGGLIDICGPDLSELLTADDSSLTRALDRILATDKDDAYASFNQYLKKLGNAEPE
jgi:FXSXX-COOH protein